MEKEIIIIAEKYIKNKNIKDITKYFKSITILKLLYEYEFDLSKVRNCLINDLGFTKSSVSKQMNIINDLLIEIIIFYKEKADSNEKRT
jgi:hypothetical protein